MLGNHDHCGHSSFQRFRTTSLNCGTTPPHSVPQPPSWRAISKSEPNTGAQVYGDTIQLRRPHSWSIGRRSVLPTPLPSGLRVCRSLHSSQLARKCYYQRGANPQRRTWLPPLSLKPLPPPSTDPVRSTKPGKARTASIGTSIYDLLSYGGREMRLKCPC